MTLKYLNLFNNFKVHLKDMTYHFSFMKVWLTDKIIVCLKCTMWEFHLYLDSSMFTLTSKVFLTQPCNISLLSSYYILGFGLEISESDDT